MISLEQINKTIQELEASKDTTYAVCERLACLYTVRDHMGAQTIEPAEKIALRAAGEFSALVNGKNTVEVWKIMDDLIDAIKVLHPRMYDSLIAKIKAL